MRQPKSQKAKGRPQRPNATQQPSEIEDMEDLFSETDIEGIRASLLGWYALNHRDLPWRITEDDVEKRAYRVWVSEVMLQQTRVLTVISYFDRWMLKWPTIRHLSQASMEEVNEMWAGLGYYRRARYLLEGAKKVVAEGGVFPKTVSSLQKIPGIGDYTSGAIASIAFKEVVPVVDGNVVRVIARLKAISANPKDSSTIKKFWHLATQLVDPIQPGDFNQALMELGATVCTPLRPNCSSCPVSSQCCALSISTKESSVLVTDYPAKVLKVKQRDDFSAVCVVEILGNEEISAEQLSNSKFLIIKRPEEGLLAGLWEFPSVLVDGEADLTARRKAIDQFLKKNFSIDSRRTCKVVLREQIGDFVHVFSHIRLKVYVEYLVLHLKDEDETNSMLRKQDNESLNWKCVDSKVLSNMGLTSGVRKVYTMVEKFKQQKFSLNLSPVKGKSKKKTSKQTKILREQA